MQFELHDLVEARHDLDQSFLANDQRTASTIPRDDIRKLICSRTYAPPACYKPLACRAWRLGTEYVAFVQRPLEEAASKKYDVLVTTGFLPGRKRPIQRDLCLQEIRLPGAVDSLTRIMLNLVWAGDDKGGRCDTFFVPVDCRLGSGRTALSVWLQKSLRASKCQFLPWIARGKQPPSLAKSTARAKCLVNLRPAS